jgi:nucleotide-binding universal stress UspA family protein
MNAKGGSDVVAIVGHQVGLLSGLAYTSYTVVAIITVLFTPTAMRMLEHRSSASGTERQRLENEQASARAYTFTIERVLIPASAELYPELAMEALEKLAPSQNRELLAGIEKAAARHDLTAIGPHAVPGQSSLGGLADAVIHRCRSDVLIVIAPGRAAAVAVGGSHPGAHQRSALGSGGCRSRRPHRRVHQRRARLAQRDGLASVPRRRPTITQQRSPPGRSFTTAHPPRYQAAHRVREGNFPGDDILAEITESDIDLIILGCTDRGQGSFPALPRRHRRTTAQRRRGATHPACDPQSPHPVIISNSVAIGEPWTLPS